MNILHLAGRVVSGAVVFGASCVGAFYLCMTADTRRMNRQRATR